MFYPLEGYMRSERGSPRSESHRKFREIADYLRESI